MKQAKLFISVAAAAMLALNATADAGPLGGLVGGIGGRVNAGVGVSLDGDVDAPASLPPVAAPHVAPARSIAVTPPPVVYAPQIAVARRRQSAALIAGGVTVLSAPAAYVYMDVEAEDLRHDLEGTGVTVIRRGDAVVLEMPSDVTFAFNHADIQPRFFQALEAVARTLNKYPATYVDVIGHTDAIGGIAYNQALSERRAASVADFIQRREAIPARLYVAGRGKLEPIATNATPQGRAENRRVEITLHPFT
jgi:outer membrane protein OmpA-like peptidoglycan-associated protein